MSDDLSGLSLPELFDQLIQPEAPPPISMWPQTTGWLWLAILVLLLATIALWRWRRRRRETAYRRLGCDALQKAGDDPAAIADVLKRTALAGFPRDEVAALYGNRWLEFLDRTGTGQKFAGTEAGKALISAPYVAQRPNGDLASMAEEWIKMHKNDRRLS